ncbi:acyltransferase [Streptomyces sp. ISL-11]|uniref:acyltransferase family protein n=1 Tax=Streptomyces sp. ISL-11 TaxID=2819174 RepID=UPI001BEC054A|nr:acyltransferase [Streptomyces sp. ISL-11]MBT2387727.1 acyltransferase [Streptomyces sp. ISL-11]
MSLITATSTIKPSGKPPTSRVRLDSLTGLRWYAALLVACFHFAYEEASTGTSLHVFRLKEIVYAGPSAVSFFFILSGFVLAWSARPRDTVTGFWRRRFARIYPSHLVTFCVAVLTMVWMGKELDPRIALANLGLLQSWVPNRKDWWFGYNGVSWSLSCEFLFYLSFPFVIKLVRRFSNRGLWATVVVGNLGVALAPLYMKSIERAADLDPKFLLYVFPPTRLMEFVIGIAVALLVKNGAWRGPGLTASLALAVLVVLGPTHVMPFDFHWAADTVIPFTLTIAAAARADVRGEPSPFRDRINVYLGEVSFAFYLVHEIVIFSVDHFLKTHHLKIPLTLHLGLFLAVSLVGAVLVHEYVEKPGVKLLTRSRKKSQPAMT